MKRKGIIGVVIAALICVCIALNCKIVDPADYTGAWYRAGDGILYIFEDDYIRTFDNRALSI